jgi:hypothetical protein
MPGLDPGIHAWSAAANWWPADADCRVEPDNDDDGEGLRVFLVPPSNRPYRTRLIVMPGLDPGIHARGARQRRRRDVTRDSSDCTYCRHCRT